MPYVIKHSALVIIHRFFNYWFIYIRYGALNAPYAQACTYTTYIIFHRIARLHQRDGEREREREKGGREEERRERVSQYTAYTRIIYLKFHLVNGSAAVLQKYTCAHAARVDFGDLRTPWDASVEFIL